MRRVVLFVELTEFPHEMVASFAIEFRSQGVLVAIMPFKTIQPSTLVEYDVARNSLTDA